MYVEHSFDPRACTVKDARRLVQSTLDAWAVPEGDSVLLVSELATNAVLHARTPYTVTVSTVAPERVRVAVTDDDPSPPIANLPGSDHATCGRGMYMVLSLAQRWGCEPVPGGKTVWFET
ncbi:MAG: ATP-binding protein [Actinomycetota bacterium]|nr:ATP-binding protein [Actinomycetota bacterium]MDQ6945849.1 ATP-binding protein [Actinomycetota bacterium]